MFNLKGHYKIKDCSGPFFHFLDYEFICMQNSKFLFLAFSSVLFIFIGWGCQPSENTSKEALSPEEVIKPSESKYDSLLAQKYGADDFGMKKYVFAFLNRGPNQTLDSLEAMKLQTAHLKNIERLAIEGKLVLAGPFFGNEDLRGIYVFDVSTIEEAEKLVQTDPAIQAGSLVMELKEWYGSAALMAVNDLHYKVSKQNIVE